MKSLSAAGRGRSSRTFVSWAPTGQGPSMSAAGAVKTAGTAPVDPVRSDR
jgi:hypothetical protein